MPESKAKIYKYIMPEPEPEPKATIYKYIKSIL